MRVWRSPLAWGLALVFAGTSSNTFAMFTWLPPLLVDSGMMPPMAGTMLAYYAILALPTSLLVPLIASRLRNPLGLGLLFIGFYAAGYAGLLLSPSFGTWLWITLAGLGQGTFALALLLVNLRTRTTAGAGALSGFAQGIGYTVACAGPLAFGLLRDVSGDWALPSACWVPHCFSWRWAWSSWGGRAIWRIRPGAEAAGRPFPGRPGAGRLTQSPPRGGAMKFNDLLADAYGRIQERVHQVLAGLDADQLVVRPGGDSNSIAWLVWHLTRVQDDHIADVAGTRQYWLAGWSEQFDLPLAEKDHGYGHTSDQVAAVRVESADLLRGYYDDVHAGTLSLSGRAHRGRPGPDC